MKQSLKRAPLYALHVESGALIVPFAGYEMPLHYREGVMSEHRHTRDQAGLFDVSHMGQITIGGNGAAQALERLTPADLLGLAPMRQRYALLTNDAGGIIDDVMTLNTGDEFLSIVNAARKAHDYQYLQANLPGKLTIKLADDRALLALQGPAAAAVLGRLAPEVAALDFMAALKTSIAGVGCLVARSGYTGEDGFEISLPAQDAESLARQLLEAFEVRLIGLGARDTLRLEAGLCLYGQDIDEQTTPVEAGLAWAVAKVRRTAGARAGGFPGADTIFSQLEAGPAKRRVGLRPQGRAPIRAGAELTDEDGNPIGRVTSGGFAPCLGHPAAMGYVAAGHADPDATAYAAVRGKRLPATIARLPFVPHKYRKNPSQS